MASVTVEDVRDIINISPTDIPDEKIQKMIKRAETTLELELEKEIDYNNCTEPEKEFITLLAAVYAICHLTGGSAVGLNFSMDTKHNNHKQKPHPTTASKTTPKKLPHRRKNHNQKKQTPKKGDNP